MAEILGKLGGAEMVYDYELGLGNMILPCTLVFDCDGVDLLEHKSKIDAAIKKWKSMHPKLGAKIVSKPDPLHKFSNERYFARASEEKLTSLDNVSYLRLIANTSAFNYARYVDLLTEYELNARTVDAKNGLLWRLHIVELSRSHKYAIIFTAHHAIIDAKNGFTIVNQLLEFIDAAIDERLEKIDSSPLEMSPSIEEKLFANDPAVLNNVKINKKFDISPERKIPNAFGKNTQSNSRLVRINEADRFEFLADENNNTSSPLLISDLIQGYYNHGCKFTSFVVDQDILKQLLAKCKKTDAKLTGCLNVIASIAILELLKRHTSNSTEEKVYFHLLANLRPFLNLGDLNVGYWAVVMNSIVDCKGTNINSSEFNGRFWELTKLESDSIHSRIKAGELFENAKLDTMLLDLINKDTQFESGGGVHFALSNLGSLSYTNLNKLIQREFYFCTSLKKNRWSSLIFHGLCSIDNRLCWGISYVTEFLSDAIIEEYMDLIQHVMKCVI